MAISHNDSASGTSTNSSTVTVTPFRVQGTDRVLLVKVAWATQIARSVTSVVWDAAGVNEALEEVISQNQDDADSSIWVLAAPTAKIATVTVTLSATGENVAGASCYSGVNQVNPIRTSVSASGTDASPTVDLLVLDTEVAIDSLGQVSDGPDTATGDHTERHDAAATDIGDDVRGAGQEVVGSGAIETMGWTMGGSDSWSICAVTVAPVPLGTEHQVPDTRVHLPKIEVVGY